jgi:hypothetical protein
MLIIKKVQTYRINNQIYYQRIHFFITDFAILSVSIGVKNRLEIDPKNPVGLGAYTS